MLEQNYTIKLPKKQSFYSDEIQEFLFQKEQYNFTYNKDNFIITNKDKTTKEKFIIKKEDAYFDKNLNLVCQDQNITEKFLNPKKLKDNNVLSILMVTVKNFKNQVTFSKKRKPHFLASEFSRFSDSNFI